MIKKFGGSVGKARGPPRFCKFKTYLSNSFFALSHRLIFFFSFNFVDRPGDGYCSITIFNPEYQYHNIFFHHLHFFWREYHNDIALLKDRYYHGDSRAVVA